MPNFHEIHQLSLTWCSPPVCAPADQPGRPRSWLRCYRRAVFLTLHLPGTRAGEWSGRILQGDSAPGGGGGGGILQLFCIRLGQWKGAERASALAQMKGATCPPKTPSHRAATEGTRVSKGPPQRSGCRLTRGRGRGVRACLSVSLRCSHKKSRPMPSLQLRQAGTVAREEKSPALALGRGQTARKPADEVESASRQTHARPGGAGGKGGDFFRPALATAHLVRGGRDAGET